jgi:hypothetical protein
MTALHIRQNLSELLQLTSKAVNTVSLPGGNTVADKIYEYRIRAAALLMPKGSSIHI